MSELARLFDLYLDKKPITLIDIGARGGLEGVWKNVEGKIATIFFEPEEEGYRELVAKSGKHTHVFQTAVHSSAGTVPLYVTRKPANSSILKPNIPFLKGFGGLERFDILQELMVQTDTLDSVLATKPELHPDFIKIDTQGSELAILEGAEKTLRQCVGVEIEVEFAPIYENQPLFPEVDIFMRAKGYELHDLNVAHWKRGEQPFLGYSKGQIVFANALYIKRSELLTTKRQAERALAISFLYGRADHAAYLLDRHPEAFGQEERPLISALIKKHECRWEKRLSPSRIFRSLFYLYKLFHLRRNPWLSFKW